MFYDDQRSSRLTEPRRVTTRSLIHLINESVTGRRLINLSRASRARTAIDRSRDEERHRYDPGSVVNRQRNNGGSLSLLSVRVIIIFPLPKRGDKLCAVSRTVHSLSARIRQLYRRLTFLLMFVISQLAAARSWCVYVQGVERLYISDRRRSVEKGRPQN